MSGIFETDQSLRLEFINEVNRSLAAASLQSLGVQIPRKCLGVHRAMTPILTTPTPFQRRFKSPSNTSSSVRLSPLMNNAANKKQHPRPRTSILTLPKTPTSRRRRRPQTTASYNTTTTTATTASTTRTTTPIDSPTTFNKLPASTWFGHSNFPHFHQNPPPVIQSTHQAAHRATTAPTNKKRNSKNRRQLLNQPRRGVQHVEIEKTEQHTFHTRSGFPNNTNIKSTLPPFPLILVDATGNSLSTIDLSCWKFSSKSSKFVLRSLRTWSCNTIISLNLSTTLINTTGLNILPDLISLNTIVLNDCKKLNYKTMHLLSRCKQLKKVSLRNSPKALGMPEMMPLLSYLYSHGRHAEDLDFYGTNISNEAIETVASLCISLYRLSIGGNETTVTNVGIHELMSRCRTIRVLETEKNVHVTGAAFLMDGLGIGFNNDGMHDQDIDSNQRCPQISPFTPESEKTIETYGAAPMSLRLKEINLTGCLQTNNRTLQIVAISSHQHLLSINLNGCKEVGDESLKYLSDFCINLQTISIGGCTEITSSGVIWLVAKGGDQPGSRASEDRLPCLNRINMHGLYRIQDKFLNVVARSNYILRMTKMEYKGMYDITFLFYSSFFSFECHFYILTSLFVFICFSFSLFYYYYTNRYIHYRQRFRNVS